VLAAVAVACLLPSLGCSGMREWWSNGFKVGPQYSPPAAPMAERWIDADSPQVRPDRQQDARWWMLFGDPVLDQLVSTASRQNLTLRMAACRIVQARAERGIAVGTLFPQTQEMTGQYARNAYSQNTYPFDQLKNFGLTLPYYFYDSWSAGVDAAWEIDFWGRFRRGVEAADANLDTQVAGYDGVLVMLQAEVATNYIQMRAYQERLTLALKNVELQRQILKIVEARYRQGTVTELDVQQAKTTLGVTESTIPVFETGRRRAQNRLRVLMGTLPEQLDACLPEAGSIPAAPAEIVVGIPADLLRRRPDVRQAERQAAAQSARIGVAKSEFYPHLIITGAIGVQAERFNELFEPSSLGGSIGPTFRWNLLNYGRIANNVKSQDAQFQQALLNYCDTVLRANEEVEDAIVAFLRERERVRSLDDAARAAQRAVDLAVRQYDGGLISYQPLLDGERVLVQQQDALTESRGLVAIDLVAVYRALAGGWTTRLSDEQGSAVPAAQPDRKRE
jgi:NodT family efflux transporter outer membrane factor (OMF) lipoprotein